MAAGGSAQSRAEELRTQAAQARAHADALEAQAGAWAAGADGERRVAAALLALPTGWDVHHDRLLRPGRAQTNLDHVVVGPSGVYLVDTKNWAGGTSVHEGNLWQHTSSSSPKGRELDAVARFAGEMEKSLGLPVVPVIALAGGRSTSFARQRVRGVEIIPVDGLVAWLLTQPRATEADGADLLSRKVAHTYPSASEAPASTDPDVLTVADVLGAERPTSRRTPPVTAHIPARRPLRQARRRPRRRGSVVSGLVGLVALWAFSQVGPHLLADLSAPGRSGASSTSGVSSAPGGSSTVEAPGPTKACQSLTRTAVLKLTGAKTALVVPTPDEDTCSWWLAKPRYAFQTPDVMVKTGASVDRRFAANGTTAARIDMTPGEVSAWIPLNTRLDGWKAGTRARQSFIVWLRFGYPVGANDAKARAVEATAEKKVARLAEELAKALSARRAS